MLSPKTAGMKDCTNLPSDVNNFFDNTFNDLESTEQNIK
jgi:hypothetical protein